MANAKVSTRDTQLEKQRMGYNGLVFSEMDTTAEPKIQSGSTVEVAGTLYSFTAEESNTGWAGIANSTQAYLYLDPSVDGSTVSAVWTDTAPTWDTAKYGYYASGTSNRYVLRCYKSSTGWYTLKYIYEQQHDNRYVDGDNIFSGKNSFDDLQITSGNVIKFDGAVVLSGNTKNLEFIPYYTNSGQETEGTAYTRIRGLIPSNGYYPSNALHLSSGPIINSILAIKSSSDEILLYDQDMTSFDAINQGSTSTINVSVKGFLIKESL